MTDDIKCPVCGSNTRLRTSKQDGSKFHVCINYPDCRGKVAFEDEFEDEREKESPTTRIRAENVRHRTDSDEAVQGYPRGWNWGAFCLTWIWGIGNDVYIALLALIPGANFVMALVLGIYGNKWAWENHEWRDIKHFRSTQRTWATVGLVLWAIWFVICIIILIWWVITPKPYYYYWY